jgi:nucleotide-binding universal stress UspA family protein
MIRQLLVGYDGSDSAKHALAFARELSEQTGAKITLMTVIPPSLPVDPLAEVSQLPVEPNTDRYFRQLDEAAAGIPAGRVEKRIERGHVAEVLCEQGHRLQADLIVVGARGLSAGGRWLLGSVSDRVVHHAGRPVTVVH